MESGQMAEVWARRLGVETQELTFLRASQNLVFRLEGAGGTRILRVTREEHRSAGEIAAELEWVAHLHAAGAPVGGALSEVMTIEEEGEAFHGVIFERAPGRAVERGDLSEEFYRAHGRVLGALHRLAQGWTPAWAERRKRWDEERYFTRDIAAYLPEEFQEELREVFARMRARVEEDPRTAETFGPVHFDLGYSNFFVEGGRLTVFDFDNCTAGYFLGDIAAALYGGIFTLLRCEFPGDRGAFARPRTSRALREILPAFRDGYEEIFAWPREAEERLQAWLEVLYFRSVVHAWRMQWPVENPKVRAALMADVENLLTGRVPISTKEG